MKLGMDGCMYDWKLRNVVNFAALQRVWLESLVQLKMETETDISLDVIGSGGTGSRDDASIWASFRVGTGG